MLRFAFPAVVLLCLLAPLSSGASIYANSTSGCDQVRCVSIFVQVVSLGCTGSTCWAEVRTLVSGSSSVPGILSWSGTNAGHSGACALQLNAFSGRFSCSSDVSTYFTVPVWTNVCHNVSATTSDTLGSITRSTGVCGVIDP